MSMYPILEPGDSIYIDKGIYKIKGLKKELGKDCNVTRSCRAQHSNDQ